MVRAKLPNATIGFFLHVAFPSSEIFRCLAVRESLLRGMLGADVVGFQTHSYARHFRQTVSRILTLEALPGGIDLGSSLCEVAIFPIGIDVLALAERRRDPTVQEWVDVLKERYAGMKMIVGRDKLDEVQGVRQKLLAFEAFLEKYTEFQGKVVLIQVALATTEENEGQVAVFDVVSRINSRFSTLTYQITWHSGFSPPAGKLETVKKLLANKQNEVWILSGMGVQGGLEKIAAELPGVGLVAENGCMIKPPGQNEWINLVPDFNLDWKAPTLEILTYYTDRTPGTFTENRGSSLCWRFGNEKRDEAAQKWVRRSAAEAQNHIWDSLGEIYGLRIIPGSSSFLILPKNVSRSTAVGTILSSHETNGPILPRSTSDDVALLSPVGSPLSSGVPQHPGQRQNLPILYVGVDEHLIRRLNELSGAETCASGGRATFAKWRIDATQIGDVLASFS
ncbi:hypothetical protein RSAG8_00987, partial [Rhizoctonia solani AG-8 WAC10335]